MNTTEDLIDAYEAKRDDFARWLAGYNVANRPTAGRIAANLFIIGHLVGSVSRSTDEDYAQEATDAVLYAYSTIGHAEPTQYFKELIDELFDRHVAPLAREVDPEQYLPFSGTGIEALMRQFPNPFKGA